MPRSHLSINGRSQPISKLQAEPRGPGNDKSNMNRGQINYHGRGIEFDQNQLVFEKAQAKSGKVAAAPTGPVVEQEELDEELMSANKFKEFSHLFENMTVETRFITDQKFVVDVIIANDGDKILALVMVNEEHY